MGYRKRENYLLTWSLSIICLSAGLEDGWYLRFDCLSNKNWTKALRYRKKTFETNRFDCKCIVGVIKQTKFIVIPVRNVTKKFLGDVKIAIPKVKKISVGVAQPNKPRVRKVTHTEWKILDHCRIKPPSWIWNYLIAPTVSFMEINYFYSQKHNFWKKGKKDNSHYTLLLLFRTFSFAEYQSAPLPTLPKIESSSHAAPFDKIVHIDLLVLFWCYQIW